MSSAAVVVSLDPEECVLPNVGEVVPRPGVDEFFLVGCEERLGDCVIEAGGAAAHRADHAIFGAEVGELLARVLTAAVAVEDDAFGGLRVSSAAVSASMIKLVRKWSATA